MFLENDFLPKCFYLWVIDSVFANVFLQCLVGLSKRIRRAPKPNPVPQLMIPRTLLPKAVAEPADGSQIFQVSTVSKANNGAVTSSTSSVPTLSTSILSPSSTDGGGTEAQPTVITMAPTEFRKRRIVPTPVPVAVPCGTCGRTVGLACFALLVGIRWKWKSLLADLLASSTEVSSPPSVPLQKVNQIISGQTSSQSDSSLTEWFLYLSVCRLHFCKIILEIVWPYFPTSFWVSVSTNWPVYKYTPVQELFSPQLDQSTNWLTEWPQIGVCKSSSNPWESLLGIWSQRISTLHGEVHLRTWETQNVVAGACQLLAKLSVVPVIFLFFFITIISIITLLAATRAEKAINTRVA